jgi:hypothetical protein
MTTPLTSIAMREAAHGLFASDGVPVSVIRDSAGCVTQRVLAHIVNIGCDIAQQGIATPEDIDRAVTLGLGYPKGPLALGDALGAHARPSWKICSASGDPRYRPALAEAPRPPRRLATHRNMAPDDTRRPHHPAAEPTAADCCVGRLALMPPRARRQHWTALSRWPPACSCSDLQTANDFLPASAATPCWC